MYRCTDGQMDGWTDGQMDGQTDERMYGCMDVWMDGWTDRQMDGWTDGRMDRWTDGHMDGKTDILYCHSGGLNPWPVTACAARSYGPCFCDRQKATRMIRQTDRKIDI